MTDDEEESKGESKVGANSLPNDAVINDLVALVIMVDEGKDDSDSKMDNLVVIKILVTAEQDLRPDPVKMKK